LIDYLDTTEQMDGKSNSNTKNKTKLLKFDEPNTEHMPKFFECKNIINRKILIKKE
jgi:hypothetical protein